MEPPIRVTEACLGLSEQTIEGPKREQGQKENKVKKRNKIPLLRKGFALPVPAEWDSSSPTTRLLTLTSPVQSRRIFRRLIVNDTVTLVVTRITVAAISPVGRYIRLPQIWWINMFLLCFSVLQREIIIKKLGKEGKQSWEEQETFSTFHVSALICPNALRKKQSKGPIFIQEIKRRHSVFER